MNAETTATSSSKILVVDDDLIIQSTLATALKKAGLEVCIAGDISEALVCVRREKPDLMLLDISFPLDYAHVGSPAMDGFFVVEWLRRTPEAAKIPIILMSSTDPAKYKDQIQARGLHAYFCKPLDHVKLLASIRLVLAKNVAVKHEDVVVKQPA